MFNQTLQAKIRSLKHNVRSDDGLLVRRSQINLHIDFTPGVASGISNEAATVQQLLKDRSMQDATISMDALKQLRLKLGDGDQALEFDGYGIELQVRGANAEDAAPKGTLLIGFATEVSTVTWLLQHLEETLDVKIDKKQPELPGTEEQVAPTVRRRRRAEGEEQPSTEEAA